MNCEEQEQIAIVNHCRVIGVDIIPSFSGIYIKHKTTKTTMKSLGMKQGDPDFYFPYAKCGFHGLFIEMKRSSIYGKCETTKEQVATLKIYNERGYLAVFGIGFDETIKIIEGYMNETLTQSDIQTMIDKIDTVKVKGEKTRSRKNVSKN